MGKIKQLPEALSNQIAAGEVVERPASVVKELVENAIDAGSTEIIVELVEAGIQRIRVIDNGEGMDEEDLEMAFLPHATSKIYHLSDLFQIHSLGFRGEALASIGSVAKVRVDSTQKDTQQGGHYIKVEGSQIVEKGASNARKGTTITVDSLFYNTPARLKHLSSLKTELKHILNFVQDIALSYPAIRFTLISDQQKIFTAYGNGQLRQTIANIYQPTIARQLIPIDVSDEDFRISGFISPPQLTRTSKYYLHWIINGRSIRSYVLNDILIRAYGKQLMIGRYPLAVIRIDLDPRLVDVNVHPTKQTVRLSKEAELSVLLTNAIEEALRSANPIPEIEADEIIQHQPFKKEVETAVHTVLPFQLTQNKTDAPKPNAAQDIIEETTVELEITRVQPNLQEDENPLQEPLDTPTNSAMQDTSMHALSDSKLDFTQLRYVGQIHGTYLIAESEKGFYLIDQHAAQERLRYEQFMQYSPDVTEQQYLLLPIIFNFTLAEMEDIPAIMSNLNQLGILLEPFGPTSFQMESYPTWMLSDEVEQLVKDLTERLLNKPNLTVAEIKEEAMIMQSCRGAIKANHYLDERQAKALIHSMATLQEPYHCPHGRPVFIEFNHKTLEKLFKRIQDPHERGQHR